MRRTITFLLLFSIGSPAWAQPEHTLTPEEKLYGLSTFWKEVSYNFAFFDQVPELDWDSTYRAYIPKVLATDSDYGYYKVPELLNAKALVLDIRNNGGGSTDIGLAIAKYLTKDTLLYGSRSMTPEHRAAYKAWGYWVAGENPDTITDEWEKKSLEYFKGNAWHEFEYKPDTNDVEGSKIVVPTIILTGHNTASAAEDFLVYLDNQPHITRLGRKTYGSTGQPLFLELPGGGSARICTKKDVFPDGREFVGYGILPQIEVNPTVEDFIQDRDPALEKAVEVVKGKL